MLNPGELLDEDFKDALKDNTKCIFKAKIQINSIDGTISFMLRNSQTIEELNTFISSRGLENKRALIEKYFNSSKDEKNNIIKEIIKGTETKEYMQNIIDKSSFSYKIIELDSNDANISESLEYGDSISSTMLTIQNIKLMSLSEFCKNLYDMLDVNGLDFGLLFAIDLDEFKELLADSTENYYKVYINSIEG